MASYRSSLHSLLLQSLIPRFLHADLAFDSLAGSAREHSNGVRFLVADTASSRAAPANATLLYLEACDNFVRLPSEPLVSALATVDLARRATGSGAAT